MKVAIEGGLTEPFLSEPNDILNYVGVSRDGKYLSYWSRVWDTEKQVFDPMQKLIQIQGEKFLPMDMVLKTNRGGLSSSEWTNDNNLLFMTTEDFSNIYIVPMNGRTPKKLTNFRSGTILNYVLSTDGKRIFIIRGIDNSDIYLLSDSSK